MKQINMKVEPVFLSGTEQVIDILNNLHHELTELGFKPWMYKHSTFPHYTNDAMNDCIKAAKKCGCMIVVLDKRAGLKYHSSDRTITEEEFYAAYNNGIRRYVFVRSCIYAESRIYHRQLNRLGKITPELFKGLTLTADQKVYEFLEDLMHLQQEGNSAVPWIYQFDTAYDILEFIKELFVFSDEKITFKVDSIQTETPEEYILANDSFRDSKYSEDAFIEIVFKYSDSLPFDLRKNIYRDIVTLSWSHVHGNPFTADSILKDPRQAHQSIRDWLAPICKSALKIRILPNEFLLFYSAISAFSNTFKDLTFEGDWMIARYIRYILYEQQEIQGSSEWRQVFTELISQNNLFWKKFFTDLYFRYSCDFFAIDAAMLPIIETEAHKYRDENPNQPLTALWPLIITPLQFSRQCNSEEAVRLLMDIAKRCSDELECKWCAAALTRVFPLYDGDIFDDDFSTIMSEIIGAMNLSCIESSSSLLYVLLNNLLKAFVRKRDEKYLSKYEQFFLRYYKTIFPAKVIHLQLEYSAAIGLAIDFPNKFGELKPLFFENFIKGNALQNSPLFSNVLIGTSLKLKHLIADASVSRKSVKILVNTYLSELFNLSGRHQVELSHLNALQYKICLQVFSLRPTIATSIVLSLARHCEPGNFSKPSFFAKSLAVFDYLDQPQKQKYAFDYVSKAMGADDYSIYRNALHFFRCLYFVYYYGSDANREQSMQFALSIAAKIQIGRARPKMAWVYYACMIFKTQPIELDFVRLLYRQNIDKTLFSENALIKPAATLDELHFYGENKAIINEFALGGSILAKVLQQEMNHPEVWNTIATTLFNIKNDYNVGEFLKMSAFFYSYAQAFAKTARVNGQKYYYNYIRCKSMAILHCAETPSSNFIKDTVYFLRQPESRLFSFKDECARHFFDLIEKQRRQIHLDDIKLVDGLAEDVGWIRTGVLRLPRKSFANCIAIP